MFMTFGGSSLGVRFFGVKSCGWCKQTKDLSEFYASRTNADGRQGHCKKCHLAARKKNYEDNKERDNVKSTAWQRDNKDKVSVYERRSRIKNREKRITACREWRMLYPEKQKASRANWYWRDPERAREMGRDYHHAHKDENNARSRDYKRKNPAVVAYYHFIRRHRQVANGGSFTNDQWAELVKLCGGRCLCCGTEGDLTIDHIVPVSKGGTNYIWNLQPLCLPCNLSKGVKSTDYRGDNMKQWLKEVEAVKTLEAEIERRKEVSV